MAAMQEKLEQFEFIIRDLMAAYSALKKENALLKSNLDAEHKRLVKAEATIMDLKNTNNHLRIANSVATTFEERKTAKEELNKMVREIDKCLALLTE